MARAATPAITALVAAGIEHEVLAYRHDPRSDAYGNEAVDEMSALAGVEPGQIFKTLVLALGPSRLAVAVLPVPERLSLKAAAAAPPISAREGQGKNTFAPAYMTAAPTIRNAVTQVR